MPRYDWDWNVEAWTKNCSKCGREVIGTADEDESYKIFSQNFPASSTSIDKLHSNCRDCRHSRRRTLGFDLEQLRDMHQQQDGCCSICGVPISLDRGARNPGHLDHNHSTGKLRQLLCAPCNKGLGCFFDNTDFLQAAIDYLNTHKDDSDG